MKVRSCPECKFEFKKSKVIVGEIIKRSEVVMGEIRTCPSCAVHLHYMGEDTILLAEKNCAKALVTLVEEHMSARDGINFIFEGGQMVKELSLAYKLIGRARDFLARQVDVGLSALEFCKEIISDVLHNDFWGRVIQSIAMFIGHVSPFAAEVFKRHKKALARKVSDTEVSGFSDFLSYSGEGNDPCYQAHSM